MDFAGMLNGLARRIGLYEDDGQEYRAEAPARRGAQPQDTEPYEEELYDGAGEFADGPYEEPAPAARASSFSARPFSGSRTARRAELVPEEEPVRESAPADEEPAPAEDAVFTPRRPAAPKKLSSKVVQLHDSGRTAAPAGPSVMIFCVRRKDDSSQIIQQLVAGNTVALNLEEVDDVQCQRVLDMVSGAAFALGGSIERTSRRNYLAVPSGVEIVRGDTEDYGSDGERMRYAAR